MGLKSHDNQVMLAGQLHLITLRVILAPIVIYDTTVISSPKTDGLLLCIEPAQSRPRYLYVS